MIELVPAYADGKCPACPDGDLRHRLVENEARFGKSECTVCGAWVDEGPDSYVVVPKVLPPLPEEQI